MAEYALEFRIIATESRSNDAVLLAVCRQELNENVLKDFECRDKSVSLDSLIYLSIKQDNLLH